MPSMGRRYRRRLLLVGAIVSFTVSACTTNPARIDISETNQGVAAWATFATAVIAAISAAYSFRQVRNQIESQHEFARRQLEAEYLRTALHIVRESYDASQEFVGSMLHASESLRSRKASAAEVWDAERSIRRAYSERWNYFARELRAAMSVLHAAEGESPMVSELIAIYRKSASVFDWLADATTLPVATSEELDKSEHMLELRRMIDSSTSKLASRLAQQYRRGAG